MADETVWVLADDRPGNVAQCVGVAEALGRPFRIFQVRYDERGKWHNLFRGSSLIGIAKECRDELEHLTAPPKLAIAAGRRTAPLAFWLKRRFGTKLVQIMDPGWPGRGRFDLIAAPRHDKMKPAANVLETLGSCHRAVPALLAAERAVWEPRFAHLPRPWLLLSIGGATKDYDFTPERARQMVSQTAELARTLGATIIATTSRRSGPDVEAAVEDCLPPGSHLHIWREETENPYLALVGMADVIVATGDSMNMCSEACANGGPVYIFCPPGMVNEKHARLHELLIKLGYARLLGDVSTPWSHPSLNAAIDVANEVEKRGLLG
ncbi:MAG TPA: mitochondrial fission ELM1 family protein [Candidatus Sulfotelmatobacter sp.]|jgi:mitochondrial fission protein ELM1|nr:mitochondrial fission ELM1 family protein [Candidatus Sulfotelmatobacter sp.]